jgi:GMP synthase-like glutamine amidotransferase
MNFHFFQHVPFENPGYIETWLNENNYNITSTKFFEPSYKIPSLNQIENLIIMGGPMSVYDNEIYPWLKEEKYFIKEAVKSNKRILGVCFGAQLLADALGTEIFQNTEKEIGWFDVEIKSTFQDYLPGLQLPAKLKTFHWHGDTFHLPEGAINHASSDGCPIQLFTAGKNLMGIQFHFEATETTVQNMVSNCSSELVKGKYIQNADVILNNKDNFYHSHQIFKSIMKRFYNRL